MSDIISDIQEVHTVTDMGVNLGHVSQDYKSAVLSHQYRSSPVSEITDFDIGGYESEGANGYAKYHPCARELFIPDKYDQLRSSSANSDVLSTFIESEIHIHEATHDYLTNREQHMFTSSRLFNLEATVSWLARIQSRNTAADEDFFRRMVNEVRMARGSEYVQEAIAIQNQRKWLRQQNQTGQLDSILRGIQYGQLIDDSVAKDDVVETSETVSPVHSMADWLVQNRLSEWDIDILKYSFRLVIERLKAPSPDSVLFTAASISDDEVAACDPAQQLDLLRSRVKEHSTLGDMFAHSEGSGSYELQIVEQDSHTPDCIPNIEPETLFQEQIEYRIQKAIELGYYERLPILAQSYPGISTDHTLSDIVNALYVTSDSSGRHLFIEPTVYDWAKGTKLLEMATTLWEIRSNVFLSIVRTLVQESQATWQHTIEAATLYLDGAENPFVPLYTDFIGSKEANPRFEAVRTSQRELYERYESTIEDLRTLGEAIVAENTDQIREFF